MLEPLIYLTNMIITACEWLVPRLDYVFIQNGDSFGTLLLAVVGLYGFNTWKKQYKTDKESDHVDEIISGIFSFIYLIEYSNRDIQVIQKLINNLDDQELLEFFIDKEQLDYYENQDFYKKFSEEYSKIEKLFLLNSIFNLDNANLENVKKIRIIGLETQLMLKIIERLYSLTNSNLDQLDSKSKEYIHQLKEYKSDIRSDINEIKEQLKIYCNNIYKKHIN